MEKNKWFGTCPICGLPDQNLATTKTTNGPLLYWIKRTCDHCSMVIQAEIDHAVRILQADTYQIRKELKRNGTK